MTSNSNTATRAVSELREDSFQKIGHILVNAGRLSPRDADAIHQKQSEKDVLFGEAGVAMGLIRRKDVEFAIARQFEYSVLKKGEGAISEKLVTAYDPFGSKSETFRNLRTQLLMRWLELEPRAKTLSIVSAQRGEGRSYVAANLAVSFSQLGCNTLLIDTDFRSPSLHGYFGISNRRGLSSLLVSKKESPFVIPVDGIKNLSVLPSGPLPPNPQELLSKGSFADLLDNCAKQFDLVILDTPAALPYADSIAVSMRCSASIVLARQGHTRVDELQQINDKLSPTGARVLGSVLLDF